MTRLLVSGGHQRQAVHVEPMREWRLYDRALLLSLDTETGAVERVLEWVTPPDLCPDESPSIVFKAGSVDGERITLVTQTEVLLLDREDLAVRAEIGHPWFNDLHHATWIDGRLHVVATGLDRLLVLDEAGAVVETHCALPEEAVRPIEPGRDYRKVATTKPHAAHPNYVSRTAEGRWLTRFEQQDAVLVEAGTEDPVRLPIDHGHPHDGLVHGGAVWFTTVNGHLTAVDPASRSQVRTFDLEAILGDEGPLGWCRGLHLEGDRAYVGFSRIRYTKLRRNLAWVKRRFQSSAGYVDRPTRVVALDLAAGRPVAEWDLEPHGLNAIFSILPR